MDEAVLGECRGPFTKEQLDDRHPSGWLGAPRFAVEQKEKVRPCDNYSVYGHNGTASDSETIDTEGTDSIAGLAKIWTRVFEVDENFVFKLELDDGTVLTGILHPELRALDKQELSGRLIDLARAYKQLARDPADSDLAIFFLSNPLDGVLAFFEAVALGFGARNAVKGFNLFARALRHLIIVGLVCPTTHFYDDFTHVDAKPLSDNSCECIEKLRKLLGWDFKSSEADLRPPSGIFSPLGVQFNLTTKGAAVISNTVKRKDKILFTIEEQLVADVVPERDVQSLVGVCLFAETQTAGRSGSLVLRNLRRAIGADRKTLRRALAELRDHVIATSPRIVNLRSADKPVLIFTDAAAEGGAATYGAVCIDTATGAFEFFAGTFSPAQVQKWKDECTARLERCNEGDLPNTGRREDKARQQIICQAELAVVPMAFSTWADLIAHRDVICFIDNDPAKDALILGSSRSDWSARVVRDTRKLCATLAAAAWYERVPSPSNVADLPSRGDLGQLLSLGARRVPTRIRECFDISFCELT